MLTVTCGSVTKDGVRIIEQLNTRLLTTLHYSAIADLHTLQITTAHTKSFQSAVSSSVVPWQRLLTVVILQLPRSLRCPLTLNCTFYVFSSQTPLQLNNAITNHCHSCSNCPPDNISARDA
jgi:hypothetical protein